MTRRRWSLLALLVVAAALPGRTAPAAATDDPGAWEWRRSLVGPDLRWSTVATSADGLVAIAGHDYPLDSPAGVHITRDGGTTWATLSSSPIALWHDVAMSADASVIAMTGTVSAQSRLWVSTNSGTAFTQVLARADVTYGRLAMSDDGTKMLVGSSTGVWVSTTSGSTFTRVLVDDGWQGDVAMTADGSTMYAARYTGSVFRSTNDGASWGEVASSWGTWTSFDVSADGHVALGVRTDFQRGASHSTDSATTLVDVPAVAGSFNEQLAVGGISRDGQVLIVTTYGTTSAVSTDGGATWGPSGSPEGWLRFALSDDGSKVYGAVENTGIWMATRRAPTVIEAPEPRAPVPGVDLPTPTTTRPPVTTVPVTTVPAPVTTAPSSTVVDDVAPAVAPPPAALIASTPPSDLGVVPPTLGPGEAFEVTLDGFTPGEWVYVYVASEPMLVGAARADATGTVRLTIEVPQLSGRHSLVFHEPATGLTRRQAITIEGAALPSTGQHGAATWLGVVLLFAGALAVCVAARRSRTGAL